MLTKQVNGKGPQWGRNCYFSENATIVGDVTMGDDCSVWFCAVLRADVDGIRIGNRVNIQDGACVHQSHGTPVVIEDDVSVGITPPFTAARFVADASLAWVPRC